MSVDHETLEPAWSRADTRVRTARARARADRRLAVQMADFFLDEDARLDDRTRLMLAHVLRGIVDGVAQDIRRHAARLLVGRGATARAEAMLADRRDATERLTRAGILRDVALMDELIARVRQDVIADALPTAVGGPDEPSLLVRLAEVPDSVVAAAARTMMAAESRRRNANDHGGAVGSDLPAELHHRLVWSVAAALRGDVDDADADHAIAEAAARSLSAHDEGDRPDAAALKLAAAIDARPDEIAALLVEAIGDRRLALFVAVLTHALRLDGEQARAIVLEPEGDALWLALRALDLDRPTIARIGLALADADPARDIEALADQLDAIVAVTPDDARAALAPLTLPRDFRGAIRTLDRSEVR